MIDAVPSYVANLGCPPADQQPTVSALTLGAQTLVRSQEVHGDEAYVADDESETNSKPFS